MSNRIYNILFHTHTISGIFISLALYVIFFAGSFSFFRDEINSWERNEPLAEGWMMGEMDFDRVIDSLKANDTLVNRDISFNQYYDEQRLSLNISPPKSVEEKQTKRRRRGTFKYMNTQDLKTYDYKSSYSLGEFLYRLHFFAQLNFYGRSGYLLAGIVAFFFLFAVVTGVLVHWKKIVSNFFMFRPKASIKNLWTDAHTALGILGLPYQFIFALTGVYLIVGTTIMSPAIVKFIYEDNTEKAYDDFGFNPPKYSFSGKTLQSEYAINPFLKETKEKWPQFDIRSVTIYNYGDQNMHVSFSGMADFDRKFASAGIVTYKVSTGEVVSEENPFKAVSYIDGSRAVLKRLHFGDFGGISVKLIYFILGMITCFVIISGVMIWLVARDKKHVSPAKRKFNAWLVWFYLAACLSMYPVTAFSFIMVKLGLQDPSADRVAFIFQVFFWSWLLLTLVFTFIKNNGLTNKWTLVLGAVLGLMVPIANGIVTGNWLWVSLARGYSDIFLIDAFWLVTSISILLIALQIKDKKTVPDKAEKLMPA
ncbi:PepSY-associated TM helix domain-containing protein [uncultured Cyclobacterium sp.]|uniref:PepSY-associated TM helix domain-containing protein n=1 Tax=uncultured Cyclobacterium sp. TaxID=453820 RepID=UPI0030EC8990|tara:strand:+ start:62333 stop:63940 length:1608 start_codon:yes stop_codon:yes gene_type:complete